MYLSELATPLEFVNPKNRYKKGGNNQSDKTRDEDMSSNGVLLKK